MYVNIRRYVNLCTVYFEINNAITEFRVPGNLFYALADAYI